MVQAQDVPAGAGIPDLLPAPPLGGSSVKQEMGQKMSADNEHLILGRGQVIFFSETGFFFIVFNDIYFF